MRRYGQKTRVFSSSYEPGSEKGDNDKEDILSELSIKVEGWRTSIASCGVKAGGTIDVFTINVCWQIAKVIRAE